MAEASKARVHQLVSECFVKAAHVILASRIIHSSRTLTRQGPKYWVSVLEVAAAHILFKGLALLLL